MSELTKIFSRNNIAKAVVASVIIGLGYAVITADNEIAQNRLYAAEAIKLASSAQIDLEQYQANAQRYERFRVAYLINCKCLKDASIEEIDATIDRELLAVIKH